MDTSSKQDIPYYQDYLSQDFQGYLAQEATEVKGVPGLVEIGQGGGLENQDSLKFVCALYAEVKVELNNVLNQRVVDRKFIDERMKSYYEFNQEQGNDFAGKGYKTLLGDKDADNRIVVGPKLDDYSGKSQGAKVAPIPEYLQGNHVTLFGPPDNAKLSINAMNAFHRKLKGEPQIVTEILKTHTGVPKWGADDEDSKTPLRSDLINACTNLTSCLNRDLKFFDEKRNTTYELAADKLSFPIKRFPGLALPCSFLSYRGNPIPLHLYDFALHLFENWHNPEALVFYVPKLENEEEARYIKIMMERAENRIKEIHPEYKLGTIRLIIVLENPRAVFRVNEMMDELFPYFAGASLGWHDYLGSTARLFKEDGNYRIPVKADPDIVIKYIKASHDLLANVVGERGGIKIGGMYGILPITNDLNTDSFQITIKGFFRDVITQMKRDLSGFWVAHPDFVRIGMAIVEAWKFYAEGEESKLKELIDALLNEKYRKEIWDFVKAQDIQGLDLSDELYARSLIVADIKESSFIANNHPDEIRYNVFQSLQYLTDWLTGNGCVALPSQIDGIAVRVMDDLATAERSRWEVWHELYHNRFSVEDFIQIAHEEMNFIRRDLSDSKKIVQVKYTDENAKWYPVAMKLMLKMMTDEKPVEFATELLLPFTIDSIRNADDPWGKLAEVDPHKYQLSSYVEKYNYYFEMCGSSHFASSMAHNTALDLEVIEDTIMQFSIDDIIQAASFHGNIGESLKNLDAMAKSEQEEVSKEHDDVKTQLLSCGSKYLKKFGIKFLVSAKGKSAIDLLDILNARMSNTKDEELRNAQYALSEITLKRMEAHPLNTLKKKLDKFFLDSRVTGLQISIASGQNHIQTICYGDAVKGEKHVTETTLFEIASLSKTYASAYAIEFFAQKQIALDTSVNQLLAELNSPLRLSSTINDGWNDKVQLKHLMSHCALNMHYVNGIPGSQAMPDITEFLNGNTEYDYESIDIINEPGTIFKYSGGGFLVLEYLIQKLGADARLNQKTKQLHDFAFGYNDQNEEIQDGFKKFPLFAAGMMGTSLELMEFLSKLTHAYHHLDGCEEIGHDTAVQMLHGTDKGFQEFMGANMGMGVFIVEAGENKFALHQGANDGFRALYLYCIAGPDLHKGLSILCNSEVNGVVLNSLMAQEILKALNIAGIDFTKFESYFSLQNIPTEEIVNMGYKNLILNAFQPSLPEAIETKGPRSSLAQYNLATTSSILKVSNQKFARAENLLSPYEPVFDPKLFGKQGKVMDSWESARHNENEYDELEIKLKEPSEITFISLSTKYHLGNQVEFVVIEAKSESGEVYQTLLEKTPMEGHAEIKIQLGDSNVLWNKLKVKVYPDGGLTRLGLYKELPENETSKYEFLANARCIKFTDTIPATQKPMAINTDNFESCPIGKKANYASLAHGAKMISATDEHYSPAKQVLSPFPPLNMFDGLESKRSRQLNHFEEVVFELGDFIDIGKIILDFTYFVNNNPVSIQVDYEQDQTWYNLIPETNVKAYAGNRKEFLISSTNNIKKLRVLITPDGGINRIKIYQK